MCVYTAENTVVKGNGRSWNLNNKYDALKLAEILNSYEDTVQNLRKLVNIDERLNVITIDLSMVKGDVELLKEKLE